jgi:hypothetical protein
MSKLLILINQRSVLTRPDATTYLELCINIMSNIYNDLRVINNAVWANVKCSDLSPPLVYLNERKTTGHLTVSDLGM